MVVKKKFNDDNLKNRDYIEDLAKILTSHDLSELKIKTGKASLTLRRGAGQTVVMPSAPVAAMPQAAAPVAASAEAPAASDESPAAGTAVRAPMVGTAYLASQPGADNFVSVGDAVKQGDTLMIVEAMKVMNPITAPCNGKVLAIQAQNGQPVEFDEILITLDSA